MEYKIEQKRKLNYRTKQYIGKPFYTLTTPGGVTMDFSSEEEAVREIERQTGKKVVREITNTIKVDE